ncbi:hypothetical protein ACLOJK_028027 [Asimina triloba]
MAAWADGVNNDVSNVNLIRNKEESTWKNLSIYRVPEYMVHDASRAMYRPQVVSIGPYHHGEAHLKPMEESKRRALVHMLAAAGDTRRRDVRRYMGQLKRLLRDLMSCYEQLDPRWEEENGENFLQVMLLDGVFLLEVLRRNHSMYAPSDPIFSEQRQPSIIEYIKRDMLMLENQLPFLVLEKLAAVFTGDSPAAVNQHLNRLLFKFFFPNREPTYMGPGKHILDVLRQSMIQSPEQSILKTPSVVQQLTIASPGSSPNWLVMAPTQALNLLARCMGYKSPAPVLPLSADNFRVPTFSSSRSATALCHAGIDFKGKESGGIRDIVFDEGKLQLRLPTITIDHIAEATFLNFILFEQLHLKEGRLVSSYFLFMGSIVTTPEDVAILEEKKIIECSGVCNHTVVEIIKNLTRGLSFHRKDALYQIHRQLNDYYGVSEKMCRRRVDRWHMKLCDTYFESPWSIIKLIAGVVILSATVIATCYSALSFYRPGLPVGTPRSSQP